MKAKATTEVPDVSPWHPMSEPIALKTLGKFAEELSELAEAASACNKVVARCIIQGLDGKHPETGKLNREWLAEEIADVFANMELTMEQFQLHGPSILLRKEKKKGKLRKWHEMA